MAKSRVDHNGPATNLPPSPEESTPSRFLDVAIPASDAEVSFGSAFQLVTVSTLARHLGLLNLGTPQIRTLLRALGIPVLHIGPHQFVDFAEFILAMKAALAPDAPDFHVPVRRPNSKGHYGIPADCRARQSLPPGTVASQVPALCERILAAREIRGTPRQSVASVRKWLSAAAERIMVETSATSAPLRQTPVRRPRRLPQPTELPRA